MAIKAIATDCDGVLTDGSVTLDGQGNEIKSVCFADIMGVSLGRKAGLLFAIISGEGGPTLEQIAAKFGIAEVYAGCKDKASALASFAEKHGLALEEVAFVGDDVNDLAALKASGLAVVPANAHSSALECATLVTRARGGEGAMRELVDGLLGEPGGDAPSAPGGGTR